MSNFGFDGTPRTALDEWFDAVVRHQIGLLRVVGGVRESVWRILDATEADLRRAIERRMEKHTGTPTPANVSRQERLLDDVRRIRDAAWSEVRTLWIAEMTAIAVAEPRFIDDILRTVVPVQLDTGIPPARLLRTLVTARPFEGRTLRQWADSIRRSDIRRIQDEIVVGLTRGENVREISQRVVGDVRLRGRDGVTAITRRQSEAITRTAVNHFANQARTEYARQNSRFFERELYVATLDGRTTPVCRSLDGETFPIGVGPVPPVHFNCRSLRVPQPDPEAIGVRPMKPVTERMLLREFADRNDLGRVRSRADLPRGTKSAFDAFARQRTRQLTGRVPAKTTYGEFLARQSTEFQNDVLGVTRARLFRSGRLKLDQFVDRAGAEIPLSRLARMHADAFRAAGLDPSRFLGTVPN